ncbi:RidA family protein [Paeniglutamicibacter terrestris]|uniref:RidA family protein n=1 Tax=Paeniglutamicibacter terrestris TaxID=2723403 RepID=A0ABX1G209_9MICC|nr:Rid family hydrolase [Paeniglutamicibacter terrestris]NKG19502.1 RidA family protein [Paeniglutamicibacter terrestris]
MKDTTHPLRQAISTSHAPPPSWAYSQGIIANGFLFTAGQTPHDPITDETVGITIEEQTARAMANLEAVLAAHHLDFSHVVKTTVHLHHPGRDSSGFNSIYEQFVLKPYPVRTTVGSFLGDFLVEIDAVAVIPTA